MSDEQLSNLDTGLEEKEDTHTVETIPYEVGDFVRINNTITPEEDPESYYYLERFVKKRGKIEEVILTPTLQYRVLFGDDMVYLYHYEIL